MQMHRFEMMKGKGVKQSKNYSVRDWKIYGILFFGIYWTSVRDLPLEWNLRLSMI